MQRTLKTVDEVIEALGGSTTRAGRAIGTTAQVVQNWRARGYIPAENYLVVNAALSALDKSATPALFRMRRL
jgi:hypothetical protein